MKRLDDITVGQNQWCEALDELRRKLCAEFEIETLVVFGSVVRGEADEESDIDLLVVTPRPLTRFERHQITDLVFEVNLRYGTNFSTLVIDRHFWEDRAVTVLPFRDEILKEGIPL